MEHLLVQDARQGWAVPFARSRIKALRATGMEYSSQRYVIEGITVSVRIAPGHEYIAISGDSSSPIFMDSGVIDLGSVYPSNLLRYKAGSFHDSYSTAAYSTPFTKIKGDWKLNDGGSDATQLLGRITVGKDEIKGAIPVDPQPPNSFAPGKVKNPSTGEQEVSDVDDLLAAKKLSSAIYPASCFTGKMRAYVQAMQGQPLYRSGDGAQPVSTAASWTGSVPGVVIPYFNEPYLDTLPRRTVDANCSSGVVKTTDGKHWLVNVGIDTVWIFPMKGSAGAEVARARIASTSDLSDAAKEKLECYILSTCRPVASKMVTLPLGGEYQSLSMGYGWHWNWSGTRANIVVNTEIDQGVSLPGGPGKGLRSEHFQLTLSNSVVDGATVWAVGVTRLEVVEWGVDRQAWCVAFPGGGNPYTSVTYQEKLFPRVSKISESVNAPFYVFYNRDEITLCRMAISKYDTSIEYSGSSPLNTYGPGPVYALTEGDRGGFRKAVTAQPHYKATFSIGGSSFQAVPYGYLATGVQEVTSGVSRISADPDSWGITFNVPDPGYHDFTVGYPSAYTVERRYTAGKDMLVSVGNAVPAFTIALTFTSSNVSDSYSGKTDIIIPYNDAEAIYVSNRVSRVSSLTSQNQKTAESKLHGEWTTCWNPKPLAGALKNNPHEDFLRYIWANSEGETTKTSGPISDEIKNTVEQDTQVLISRGVTHNVEIGYDVLAKIQSPIDDISDVAYYAQSGVSMENPVVLSMFIPSGGVGLASADNLTVPVVVGWA